jgi:hypothetical protein
MPPRVKEPQSLSRLLIRYKQQISALAAKETAKARHDCERAATALEEGIGLLEAGPSAMQLALNQVAAETSGLQEGEHEAAKVRRFDHLIRRFPSPPLPCRHQDQQLRASRKMLDRCQQMLLLW